MKKTVVKIADTNEREEIYKLRHDIYANELGQHKTNETGILKDKIDEINTYIVVKIDNKIAGFVSITPPGGEYGLDKYIDRKEFPFIYENMYEGRLFSVLKDYRNSNVALLLFFAVLRFTEYNKGSKIMTIGRKDLVDFYVKTGLINLERTIKSGAVEFKLLYAEVKDIRKKIGTYERILSRVKGKVDWKFDFDMIEEKPCFHGGEFFNAIGTTFDSLHKSMEIINADVLDAWFPPSPAVIKTLNEYLPWILKTSPPTHSEGLIETISKYRNIPINSILPGSGSSSLIYLALPQFLSRKSRVLIIEPSYGEYAHILEQVIGCTIDRFFLSKKNNYELDLIEFSKRLEENYDLAIIINPNNPTGIYTDNKELKNVLINAPKSTLFWIDETYIEYAGTDLSLENFACDSENIIICKSMSKVYALSGIRVGYLAGSEKVINKLRKFNPPWSINLVGQIAAVNALGDKEYYQNMYIKTHELRNKMISELSKLNSIEITHGVINSIICHIKPGHKDAATVVEECKKNNLYIRNVFSMNKGNLKNTIRISIKDEDTNKTIVDILKNVLSE